MFIKHPVLALMILLFGLSAQLSAQTMEKAQTMEGLRDIVVVVKYGRVDGKQEEWQSTLLQRLEDRARHSLEEAEVPISQSTDEPGKSGRPRLVFTVSLSRKPETDPVRVESQIVQRIRLWRDTVKELELATWTMYGVGGPMVTEKMAFDVFDGQVAEFIKTYREVNSTSQLSTEPALDKAAEFSSPPNAFEDLRSTRVFVAVRPDMSDGRPPVSEKLLQDAIETKLKAAGIKITRSTAQAERSGHALLYVWVKLSPPNIQTWAPPIGVESTFSQWVLLARDPQKRSEAVTWQSQDSGQFAKTDDGLSVITDEAVLEVVNRQLDEFIKAFKAARPPKVKAQNTAVPE
jgi:hypothetical protein